ncbi:MAG: type IV-A pilus assembly ATPase PilB [Pirellulaceae bacterium]|nr:MAG: type IV-A pilus assembly ATPase PilB [Pirellulaceae bacterium]
MSSLLAAPPRIGNILVDRGYVTAEQLQQALEYQKSAGRQKLLGEILVELGFCTEDQVVEALAIAYGVPYAKLEARLHDPRTLELISRDYIEKNLVFPLFCVRDVLTVAVTEPANLFLVDELERLTGKRVQIVATSAKDIRRMISTLPDASVFVLDDIIDADQTSEITLIEEAIEDLGDLEEMSDQSPVIRLVNYIIAQAVKEGASDIHIEPAERCVRVRHRIDGRLYKALEVPLHLIGAITSRIKIMASLDISERRLPQDGRIHVMLDGRKIDLRISTFPAARGEKTVIRVLDTRNVSLNLRELGFAEDVLETLLRNIRAPNGIILVTGPTGSGKSTTLYACLNEISDMHNNVCTVEDPIEYHLPLVNQFQVQEKIGLTFSKALRTLLRQDPDVIMVGEVRDEETARTAIQAALTGHLVFSTLHTNDAPSAITRLINMGIDAYLISAALNLVLAQRLARRICPKCRQSFEPTRQMRRALERLGFDMPQYYRGVGCRRCRNTGYTGRLGIHETLEINDDLRDAIVAQEPVTHLRQIGLRSGMVTLKHDGLRKAREGLTTVDEVLQLVGCVQEWASALSGADRETGSDSAMGSSASDS